MGGFLERFRRSAGVPAAAGGELAAELAPVFAALDRIDEEAAEIRRRTDVVAAQRANEVEEEAQGILAEGRVRANFERDDALKAGSRATDAEVVAILEQAELDVQRIRSVGEDRLPELVGNVLKHVLGAGP